MKACHYQKLSGNKSTESYSLWEAFRFYKEAINILMEQPSSEQNQKEQIVSLAKKIQKNFCNLECKDFIKIEN